MARSVIPSPPFSSSPVPPPPHPTPSYGRKCEVVKLAPTIPTPGLLGLPEAFPSWRRHQDSAIFQIRDCPKKYLGILAPTGFGKSAMAIGHALWSGDRVLILTANKGLQDQYLSDFAGIVQDIRGQANYDCHKALVTVAEAPCHAGFRCDLKQEGCDHFDLKRAAGDPATRIVLSNYQFLFHSMREREGLGHFDLVVCDECFVGETLVETPDGERRIDSLQAGDLVYNACGDSQVISTSKRIAHSLLKVKLSNGKTIYCTEDHPFFTTSGWLKAGSLGGSRLFNHQEVWALWGEFPSPRGPQDGGSDYRKHVRTTEMLRSILLKEVEEPNALCIIPGKDDAHSAENGASTSGARRKRDGDDRAATEVVCSAPGRVDPRGGGIRDGARGETGGLSYTLQGGLASPRVENSSRDRRSISRFSQAARTRSEEGLLPTEVWVESVEVVECGRGVPVYNLRVQGHPSYFASGVLVHNCHNILPELSKFLSITITGSETRQFLKSEPPSEWTSWSAHHLGNITQELEHLRKSKSQDPAHFRLVHQYKSLKRRLTTLARATPQGWMMTPGRFRGEFAWNCIWPGMYAKHYLFKRADRFLLTSASIRPEVFRSLHIASEKFHFIEYPSSIPVARRPVYYYPCIRYTADSDIHEITYLLSIVQQIIERRLDRKGIIHSVSYERAELFVRELEPKLGKIFVTHRSSAELPAAIAAFRAAKAPCVFVSPAISEGFNFPYSDAEYAILPKVPFPDHRSPIHQARSRGNKTYGMLEVCISIRQSLGRHVRADNDQGESFILDESFSWLLRSYRRFFPRDFLESIKDIRYLTPPPPPLKVR